jgi:hypothetical protein
VRFLWYPRKAALRAGIAGSSSWDDANIGDYSVAMGNGTKATGGGSAAFGTAWATHDFAFAAGVAANAAGPASVAFGSTTLASGGNSAALGHSTTASGLASTSTGYDTSAESVASFAAGRANVGGGNPTTWVETDPLFEIGNGSLQTARANAVTVLKSGDVGLRTTAPEALLHVMESSAGAVTANANSIAVFERSAGGWVSILGADGNSKGMLFGNTSDPNSGGIVYDQASVATNAMQFRTGGNTTQMLIDSSGNVGIGTNSPAFLLHVDGSAGKPGGGSWSVASDERLKKNVHELRGALEKLLELRGVTFEYVDPESIGELDGERMGLIAQEVEQVFSDWVEEGRDGYKRLTVRGFEALAVEALRELRAEKDAELTELRARLERSENAIAALSDALARMSAPLDALSPAERR